MELVLENKLTIDDLVLLSAIELFATERDLDNDCKFIMSYNEIIGELPVLFNSSERSNIAKLRKILNKEGVQKFVTREISQRGRAKGALVVFTINKELLKELNVKGIVS